MTPDISPEEQRKADADLRAFYEGARVSQVHMDDLVQTTLTRARQAFDADRGVTFSAYARQCAKNDVNEYWRKQSRMRASEQGELRKDFKRLEAPPEDRSTGDEARARARGAFVALPGKVRHFLSAILEGRYGEAVPRERLTKLLRVKERTLRR